MIRLLHKLPPHGQKFGLALSGGIDSMVVLDFLLRGGRRPTIYHFDHRTEHAEKARRFVVQRAVEANLEYFIGQPQGGKSDDVSWEEYWRNERYRFLDWHCFSNSNHPIITAHHLDDVVETWLFSAIHGVPKMIPYRRKNIIRPFLLNKKEVFQEWAEKHNVPYIHDESNDCLDHMRNRIRHRIVPEVLKVNKGIHKCLKKNYLEEELPVGLGDET